MSAYTLAPSPALGVGENTFATWDGGFSDEQITRIRELGDALPLAPATVGGGEEQTDTSIRISETGWIDLNPNSEFIYNILAYIARQLNGQFFDFDLFGFVEDLQYTVYRDTGGYYTWHLDRGNGTTAPRKLSLVLQLSDPSEYEGGDLELFTSVEPTKMEKKKGFVVAFPSFVLHRVTPVTSGTRRTLVVWLSGPKFR
jgi:PKHD-type hydroxylase